LFIYVLELCSELFAEPFTVFEVGLVRRPELLEPLLNHFETRIFDERVEDVNRLAAPAVSSENGRFLFLEGQALYLVRPAWYTTIG